MKIGDEYIDRMENLDHDLPNNPNLMQNMEGIDVSTIRRDCKFGHKEEDNNWQQAIKSKQGRREKIIVACIFNGIENHRRDNAKERTESSILKEELNYIELWHHQRQELLHQEQISNALRRKHVDTIRCRIEEVDPSLVNFPRAYLPPRKLTTKQIKLEKETKYDMVTPVIPPGVTIDGDMLGAIGNLRYADHDLVYLKKFP